MTLVLMLSGLIFCAIKLCLDVIFISFFKFYFAFESALKLLEHILRLLHLLTFEEIDCNFKKEKVLIYSSDLTLS